MAAYSMCSRPRGLAIIIDMEVYEDGVQERRWEMIFLVIVIRVYKVRLGSDVDVENMKALLLGLQFDVTIHKNLQLAQLLTVVTQFSSNYQHQEADMAVVVILRCVVLQDQPPEPSDACNDQFAYT